MPPASGQLPLTTIGERVNKIPAGARNIREESLSQNYERMWSGLIWGYSDPSDLRASPVALGGEAMRDSYDGDDSSHHNMCCKHVPFHTDTCKMFFTLERGWVVGTDFLPVIIILWPEIQFLLQYCWWAQAEIDLNWRKSCSGGK